MSCDVDEVTERLVLCSFSKLSVASPTSQLILQPFPYIYLHHSSFSNPSVASPMSQFILQPFFCFSYVTGSFSNISATSPTSQLIIQPFRCSTYVTSHCLILPLLHLCHSSFSNLSFASPTSQPLHLTSAREPPIIIPVLMFSQ